MAFLAIPAVAVSLDRMTIDRPLAALCIGLVHYAERPAVYAILCAARLIRRHIRDFRGDLGKLDLWSSAYATKGHSLRR